MPYVWWPGWTLEGLSQLLFPLLKPYYNHSIFYDNGMANGDNKAEHEARLI